MIRHRFPRLAVPWASAALAALASLPGLGGIVINEIDADQTGSDTQEFIELYDGGVGNTPLNGYFVVLFNGNGNRAYDKIDLTGKVTNANGFFVIGNTAVANVGIVKPSDFLQNGSDSAAQGDAVALFQGDVTLITANTTTSATSVTAIPPELTLVDAVVYDGGTTLTTDNTVLLDGLQLTGLSMVYDPATSSIGRVPDGGAGFAQSLLTPINPPTPGSLNAPPSGFSLSFAPATFAENAGATASTGTVSRTGATTAAVTVTLASSDLSEATVPATVEIPAGQSSATFPIAAVDDLWADGSRTVTIQASAAGYNAGSGTVTVTDNGDPVGLVINEFFASGNGDANQDGTNATRGFDEFIEIVNASATAIDLSGFKVLDAAAIALPSETRHTFPAGTVLQPGRALVLFGGGAVTEGITPAFGTAWIQKANGSNQFGLSLNDSGDTVSLRNAAGAEVAGVLYGAEVAVEPTYSMNFSPEVTGSTYASHNGLSGGTQFSPGTKFDGTPFGTVTASLTASLNVASFAENAGNAAATLTVTRPAPFTLPLVVQVFSSDTSEAVPAAATVTIPAGQPSATLAINAVDDTAQDGPQTVTITAIATGLFNGSTTVDVLDDNDIPLTTLYINELDSDQAGTDTGEFIELYDGGLGNKALDGFILVFFNGANNQSYLTIDLAGKKTNAQGYFVVGNAAVANVGLTFADNTLQNGPDAVALYKAPATSFPNTTAPTTTDLIDAVVYNNGAAPASGLIATLLPPDGLQYDEGSSNNANALARVPDATTPYGTFVAQTPTPGVSNGSSPVAGYAEWAQAYPGVGASTADADGDGYANVLEYALGTDPLSAGSVPVPTVALVGGKPQLSIPKGAIAAGDSKLTYAVESSTSLASGSWSATDVSVTPAASSLTGTYTGTSPNAWLRVVVTLAP